MPQCANGDSHEPGSEDFARASYPMDFSCFGSALLGSH